MTQPEDRNRRRTDLPLIVFGPALALGTLTALLALLAGLFGWHPNQMLVTAAAVGAAVVVAALALVYRQVTERRATEGALHNVEARVGTVVEAAMDAIVTVDESQRVVLFNAAAEAMFGCPREQAIGAPLARFIPERFRAEHERHIGRFGESGISSRRMGVQRIVSGLRSDGGEFPIDASISQITESGKKFYTVILRDVTERIRAEEALRRSQEELREFASVANSAREQEKRRIARELHDELAQALTALKMDVAWCAGQLPPQEKAVSGKLAAMQTMLDGTVAATRRIAADLRPLMLDDLGLVPAAEWLVQSFTQRAGIPCEFAVGAPGLELGDPYASAVFRILQESLTNVSRHAAAHNVDVTVEVDDAKVRVTVGDDGRGFDVSAAEKRGTLGLLGIRERVIMLGGDLKIRSSPGGGTQVSVSIPI